MNQFTSKAARMFLLATASAAMMAGFAFAGETTVGMGKTTANTLRMREYPTTDCGVVETLNSGVTVAIIPGSEEGWYHVSYAGKTGYIASDYLSQLDASEIMAPGKINQSGVGVYSGPSEVSDLKETITEGSSLTINGLDNGWYSVKCQYGTEGYIRSEYVDVNGGSAAGASTISANGSSVAATALRYKGYRYRWGAAGPSAFDCSGFTMYIYGKYGVSLPHSASAQWTGGVGTRVYKISNLQPGDLVFFRWSGARTACSHTGIYIGNNQIIHASSSKTGVIVTSLTGKYVSCFVGGKHIAT